MENADMIVGALRRLSVETGSLACMGCGREHNCGTHGCAILRASADLHEQQQSSIAELRAQLSASQREKQAAMEERDELQKAFALACRIMSDNLPACLPDNQSWQDHILDRVRTEPVCRVCGCTEDNACPGGCYWVEPDLCSACAQAAEGGPK